MKKTAQLALAGIFAFGLLAAPVAYAEDSGSTSSGGSSSNGGNNGTKADKGNQQNGGESNDKDTQQKK